jgi:hypothetical protein
MESNTNNYIKMINTELISLCKKKKIIELLEYHDLIGNSL